MFIRHSCTKSIKTMFPLSDFVTCRKRYYNQRGSGLYLRFGTLYEEEI